MRIFRSSITCDKQSVFPDAPHPTSLWRSNTQMTSEKIIQFKTYCHSAMQIQITAKFPIEAVENLVFVVTRTQSECEQQSKSCSDRAELGSSDRCASVRTSLLHVSLTLLLTFSVGIIRKNDGSRAKGTACWRRARVAHSAERALSALRLERSGGSPDVDCITKSEASASFSQARTNTQDIFCHFEPIHLPTDKYKVRFRFNFEF